MAQKFPVRGFIAAETIGRSWFEYELENTRRQLFILGHSYDEADRTVRIMERCQHRFFVEKQTPAEILKILRPSAKTQSTPLVSLEPICNRLPILILPWNGKKLMCLCLSPMAPPIPPPGPRKIAISLT